MVHLGHTVNVVLLGTVFALGAPTLKEPPTGSPWLGKWQLESTTVGGTPVPLDRAPETIEFLKENQFIHQLGKNKPGKGKYRIDPSAKPMEIELNFTEAKLLLNGIVKVEGDRLLICTGQGPASPRPREFASPKGSTDIFFVYTRLKDKE